MILQAELILAALCIAALCTGVVWVVLDIVDERAAAAPPELIGQPVRAAPPAMPSPLRADLYRTRTAPADGTDRHRRPEEPS
ncbi:hypothetical protein [Streptomyces sp. CoT10]|uniref:hypothetical protein n=1 Tax=Streptomyces sp. CoT10 TaxID=2875762 RepID=UPI001CD64052|nr:hypothetical protein [Streptomyces sp. CoT10]